MFIKIDNLEVYHNCFLVNSAHIHQICIMERKSMIIKDGEEIWPYSVVIEMPNMEDGEIVNYARTKTKQEAHRILDELEAKLNLHIV